LFTFNPFTGRQFLRFPRPVQPARLIVEAAQLGAEAPLAPARLSGPPTIEIVIGSATIRIPAGSEAATLAMVLRAVKVATA
jgi:hypothetical protein